MVVYHLHYNASLSVERRSMQKENHREPTTDPCATTQNKATLDKAAPKAEDMLSTVFERTKVTSTTQ